MRFQHIIEAVYFKSWVITMEGWESIHAMLKPRIGDEKAVAEMVKTAATENPEMDYFGNPLPKMEVTLDGVAIIPIHGPLIHHASLMEKMCGACSYDDIRRNLDQAVGLGDDLNKILLDISSPGGQVLGCPETARKIADIVDSGIRVEARTDTVIGSGAYYLACAADKISATPSALVGSIGAFIAILDSRIAHEMQGLRVDVIKSGEFKGAGTRGTSLTESQRANIQAMADQDGRMFRDFVTERRFISEEFMQGQVFVGREALRSGMVDEISDDLEACEEPYEQAEEPFI